MTDFPNIQDLIQKDKSTIRAAGEKTATEKFTEKITALDLAAKEKETEQAARGLNIPYINLVAFPISPEALKIIPRKVAEEKKIICFFYSPQMIKIGVVEYSEEIKEICYQAGERTHAKTDVYLVSENSWQKAIRLYESLPTITPISKDINITDEDLEKFKESINNLQSLQEQFKNINITDVLTLMVASALKVNASDMHVEAEESGIAVRYRIDGVLHDVANLPKEQWKKFVSRIKLLAALKINITDKPQDGRVTIKLKKNSLDIRVSTMPTTYGESIVMRILYSGSQGVTFDELGLLGSAYDRLKKEVNRPNGMIITTGPTGSGKTTTMYAILRTLNKPGVKIITLEDPVEIKMEGINQSQIDPAHDYTFAKALRSILRQDPDICMVGEIRDLETADIAIQAALTGHLMLSTIHTNSASGAIPRFLSMGVKPFLLAPAINAIIGQRLVRRVCEKCKEEIKPDAETLKNITALLQNLPEKEKAGVDFKALRFYQGRGCEECSGLGYKGRIGVYEIFTMNKEIEENILEGKISEYRVEEIAIKNGMVTMVQDGLLKALQGVTTIEEVFRVAE